MGFYIEPPNGETPLQWCRDRGAKLLPRDKQPTIETYVWLREQKLVLLAVLQHGLVGIILSPREMCRFDSCENVNGWLTIPEEEIWKHKPYLEDAEQEYKELRVWT